MLIALEYLGSVGIGVTSPQLFRANDGKLYVVKLQNNRLGTKILVNEYVAWWFGQYMGLCFPPSGLIKIDEQVLRNNRKLRLAKISHRLHFASQYLHKNRYVGKSELQNAANKQAMAGVMLFDVMFHNIDRSKNRKNLLVCREEANNVLYAIDNSHLFIRGRWSIQSLKKLSERIVINQWRAYGWLLNHFLVAEDFSPYVAKVKSIKDEDLDFLIASIPEEWLPLPSEREALREYMMIRRNLIDDIMAALYRLIPNVDRGSYFNQRK